MEMRLEYHGISRKLERKLQRHSRFVSTMSSALISLPGRLLDFPQVHASAKAVVSLAPAVVTFKECRARSASRGKVHLSMHFMPIHFCLQIHHVLHTAYFSILHRQASMCHVCHCQNWGKWPILRLLRDSHQSINRVLNLYIHHIDIM